MVKREVLGNIAIVIVACVALGATIVILAPQFMPRKAVTIPTGPIHLVGAQRYTQGGHEFGAIKGAVTIVEFSDFQCPFCARFTDSLHVILARRHDIRVVFHHFPLSIHPFAETAAEASECAARQGAFVPYHDQLFARRDSIGRKSWVAFGIEAKIVDTAAFRTCVTSGATRHIVNADIALGKLAGVVATPTLIINDTKYNGVPVDLDSIISRAVTATTH